MIPADQRIERIVDRRLREVAAELRQQRAFFGAAGRDLFGRGSSQFLANGREPESALVQDLSREAFLFTQQPQQQMLRSDMLMAQPFRFLGAVSQNALALMAQGKIDGSRYFFSNGGMAFDLL